jgi:hypothetical protein
MADLHVLSDRFANGLVGVHELKRPETVVRDRIDKNIDIRTRPRSSRARKPDRYNTATPNPRNAGSAFFSLAMTSSRCIALSYLYGFQMPESRLACCLELLE